VLLLVKI
jgi:hypothetical protein